MQLHTYSLVLESLLEPSTQYPKLTQPESRSEHTDFTIRVLLYLTTSFAHSSSAELYEPILYTSKVEAGYESLLRERSQIMIICME